jgi:hypothetical protein
MAFLIFFLVWALILGLLFKNVTWWIVVLFWISFICLVLIYRRIKGRLP